MSREPFIQLSVRVSDGSYETTLQLPIDADDDARKKVVSKWLEMQQAAIEFAKTTQTAKESA